MKEESATILAKQYAKVYPKKVAYQLERSRPELVIEFFNCLSKLEIIALMNYMLPQSLARIFHHAADGEVKDIFYSMNSSTLILILRHLPSKAVNDLISKLPLKTKYACQFALNYDKESVGYWLNPDVLVLPIDNTVEDAIHLITSQNNTEQDKIFTIDQNRNIKGEIKISRLLMESNEKNLSAIQVNTSKKVNGRASVNEASSYKEWQFNTSLPVINRKNEIIGVITYSRLLEAKSMQPVNLDKQVKPIEVVADAYSSLLASLVTSVKNVDIKS